MKAIFKSLFLASSLAFASNASAFNVSLDFSDIGIETGTTFDFSSQGDVWRATDVRKDGGAAMDAIFTITGSSGISATTDLYFLDNVARGNNMRIIMENVENASVNITITLVDAGTADLYTWEPEVSLIAQFSDLDSDVGQNRSDFAGVRTDQFIEAQTSDNITPDSSLLNIIASPTYAPDYTVAIMQTPWGPQENVIDNTAFAQSPVTAAFLMDARNTIDVVVGQQSVNAEATRHIDIDMTPDFTIIPEPTSALLGGLGMLLLLRRRR